MYGVNYRYADDLADVLDRSLLVRVSDVTLQVGDVLVGESGGVVAHIDESGALDTYHNTIYADYILRRDLVRPGVRERAVAEYESLKD
jgi:hypothetical protein